MVNVNADVIRNLIEHGVLDATGQVKVVAGTPTTIENGMVWLEISGTSPARKLLVNARDAGETKQFELARW